ncbi:MAG: hypothetical protein LBK66_14120 [Spirochaetaceae bacterium]|nr:hypothetical protein [Spirochaetaceae bacterium]
MKYSANYRKYRILYAAFALIPLLLGCAFYYFFRNRELLFYAWAGAADLPDFQRLDTGHLPAFLTWITGSLPDGLWALSGMMLLRCVLWDNKKLCRVYLPVFCFFAFFYEFLQISENINGTFDPGDLCFMVFAVVFEIFLARKCGFLTRAVSGSR